MVCLQRTRESWQIVFFITAGVYAVGGIIFCILTSGTIQPWAFDNRVNDIAERTTELEVVADDHDSINQVPLVRPRSHSNGELPTADQGSLNDVRITRL